MVSSAPLVSELASMLLRLRAADKMIFLGF